MSPESQITRVFYTDAEFEAAFGVQATTAIEMLGKYAGDICRECGGECCRRIKCEFYSSLFPTCPIFAYRPVKCRLYFCERILENEGLTETERETLNKPAVELSEALRRGWGLGIFIEPPLRVGDKSWLTSLGMEAQVAEVISSLEVGNIQPDVASAKLQDIVLRCRRDV